MKETLQKETLQKIREHHPLLVQQQSSMSSSTTSFHAKLTQAVKDMLRAVEEENKKEENKSSVCLVC